MLVQNKMETRINNGPRKSNPSNGCQDTYSGSRIHSNQNLCDSVLDTTERENTFTEDHVRPDMKIPIWMGDKAKMVGCISNSTTCDDIVYAVLKQDGFYAEDSLYLFALYQMTPDTKIRLRGKTKFMRIYRKNSPNGMNVRYCVLKEGSSSGCYNPIVKSQRGRHIANKINRSVCIQMRNNSVLDDSNSALVKKEKLLERLVLQEVRMDKQKQRIRDIEAKIEEYETRIHLSRINEQGKNYIQQLYLVDKDGAEVSCDKSKADDIINSYFESGSNVTESEHESDEVSDAYETYFEGVTMLEDTIHAQRKRIHLLIDQIQSEMCLSNSESVTESGFESKSISHNSSQCESKSQDIETEMENLRSQMEKSLLLGLKQGEEMEKQEQEIVAMEHSLKHKLSNLEDLSMCIDDEIELQITKNEACLSQDSLSFDEVVRMNALMADSSDSGRSSLSSAEAEKSISKDTSKITSHVQSASKVACKSVSPFKKDSQSLLKDHQGGSSVKANRITKLRSWFSSLPKTVSTSVLPYRSLSKSGAQLRTVSMPSLQADNTNNLNTSVTQDDSSVHLMLSNASSQTSSNNSGSSRKSNHEQSKSRQFRQESSVDPPMEHSTSVNDSMSSTIVVEQSKTKNNSSYEYEIPSTISGSAFSDSLNSTKGEYLHPLTSTMINHDTIVNNDITNTENSSVIFQSRSEIQFNTSSDSHTTDSGRSTITSSFDHSKSEICEEPSIEKWSSESSLVLQFETSENDNDTTIQNMTDNDKSDNPSKTYGDSKYNFLLPELSSHLSKFKDSFYDDTIETMRTCDDDHYSMGLDLSLLSDSQGNDTFGDDSTDLIRDSSELVDLVRDTRNEDSLSVSCDLSQGSDKMLTGVIRDCVRQYASSSDVSSSDCDVTVGMSMPSGNASNLFELSAEAEQNMSKSSQQSKVNRSVSFTTTRNVVIRDCRSTDLDKSNPNDATFVKSGITFSPKCYRDPGKPPKYGTLPNSKTPNKNKLAEYSRNVNKSDSKSEIYGFATMPRGNQHVNNRKEISVLNTTGGRSGVMPPGPHGAMNSMPRIKSVSTIDSKYCSVTEMNGSATEKHGLVKERNVYNYSFDNNVNRYVKHSGNNGVYGGRGYCDEGQDLYALETLV